MVETCLYPHLLKDVRPCNILFPAETSWRSAMWWEEHCSLWNLYKVLPTLKLWKYLKLRKSSLFIILLPFAISLKSGPFENNVMPPGNHRALSTSHFGAWWCLTWFLHHILKELFRIVIEWKLNHMIMFFTYIFTGLKVKLKQQKHILMKI